MSDDLAPREYAFYPSPYIAHAVGLLFCEDSAGDRVTVAVDAEYLRTYLAGKAAGADLGGLQLAPSAVLPIAWPGWPDEWAGRAPKLLQSVAGDLAGGMTWPEVHAAVTEAAGGMA